MKKIVSIIAVSILVAGCHFLDENMNTKYSTEDIFGSEEALESFVTGCYSAYASSGFYYGGNAEWFAPGSTLLHWSLNGLSDAQKRWIDCLSLTQFSRNPYNIQVYRQKYEALYKCNKLLKELPGSPVAQGYKDQIAAEGRFIRAMIYFDIVRRWANAPIHTEAPTTIEETNGPREPFWKIYKLILEDLTFAEENGRDYDLQRSIAGTGTGRICKDGATAMKSLVYLTIGTLLTHDGTGDNFWVCPNEDVYAGFAQAGITSAKDAFEKALACAKKVMPETSAESPFRLADSYAQLFRWTEPEDWQLRERIFCIVSTNEEGGSQLATWSLPGYYMNTTSNSNYGRIRPSRFIFQKWAGTYGGVKGTGNAANIYVSCPDPRFDVSLIHTSYIGAGGELDKCYPEGTCIYSNNRATAMPYFKKYYDPKYDNTRGYADLYVMRLAEVYLIAAEAAANLCAVPGDPYSQEAVGYVNILLARARKSTANGIPSAEPADWNLASIPTKDDLIDKIFWERAFEMLGEQHEWYDTHRMGAQWFSDHVTKQANAFVFLPEQDNSPSGARGCRDFFYGTSRFGEGKIYPEEQADVRRGLICAFPYDELVYNSALSLEDQNPSEIFWE